MLFNSISQRVEPLNRLDASFVNATAALLIDVVFQVTWKRRDQVDAMLAEKFRQVFVSRLQQDRQVGAHHDGSARGAGGDDKFAKARMHLRRAARDIDGLGA